jgi:hypothetical protein
MNPSRGPREPEKGKKKKSKALFPAAGNSPN